MKEKKKMSIVIILLIVFVCIMLGVVVCCMLSTSKGKNLQGYESIDIGMAEDEMLDIMGYDYNKCSLKNGRFKYEWRKDASSFSYKGFRTYSGVSKIDIYVKDGKVEEIRPYNVK